MRKGETLEAERARKVAEAALPGRVERCRSRVAKLATEVMEATLDLRRRDQSNPGGERNGMMQ